VKTLIVTLLYHHYGDCMISWAKAANYWRDNYNARFDWVYLHGKPDDLPQSAHGHDVVTRKYQQARELFLAGNYDVMIAIEDDMVIPVDTFPRLMALLKTCDVGYGLYCWRHGVGGGNWSAYTKVEDTPDDYGESIVKDKPRAKRTFESRSLVSVRGLGFGCTAIKRNVLEAIPFERRGKACNDWYFAVDCQANGFTQMTDMGLVCGHMTVEPSPRVIYPDTGDMDTMQRIDYLSIS